MIKLYIANLGKYNEGYHVGAWLELPASEEEIEELKVKIGIAHYDSEGEFIPQVIENGVYYEEWAIHDYETDIEGLKIGEYDNIEELNEIAELWDGLQDYEQKTVQAILEWGTESSIKEAIENVDNYRLMEGITNDEEYGDYIIDEGLLGEIPENLSFYIDSEKLGRDWYINGDNYYSEHGLIERC